MTESNNNATIPVSYHHREDRSLPIDMTPIINTVSSYDQIHLRSDHWLGRNFYENEILNSDPLYEILDKINRFLRSNPEAAKFIRENISLTKRSSQSVSKVSLAKPIYYDDSENVWGYLYDGQISPPGRMASIKGFIETLKKGSEAEKEFADFLKSAGYSSVEVFGGRAQPDVVADGLKFEIGSGPKKTLWLGSAHEYRGYDEKNSVDRRRKVLDNIVPDTWKGDRTIDNLTVYNLWKSTGYDFLVMKAYDGFNIYRLNANPNLKVFGISINPLQVNNCNAAKIKHDQANSGWTINYESINWENATILKFKS